MSLLQGVFNLLGVTDLFAAFILTRGQAIGSGHLELDVAGACVRR